MITTQPRAAAVPTSRTRPAVDGEPSAVLGSALCTLEATPESVPRLRRFVRHAARAWDLSDDVEYALCLVVTELATNVVTHSGSPDLTLALTGRPGTLTVQVVDSGQWLPSPVPARGRKTPSTVACGGRGLNLVRAHTTHCEIHRSGRGTSVTATFAVAAPQSHESRDQRLAVPLPAAPSTPL
ncbi:ATP-binding protein [Streptomyces sp. NA04227]|uniref:ATP-binding protein n=1 Tax=Streptomyces sp. NA04227 TaxID=2742136 RepID=UPI0015923757|nr:ATP-binding protein [Streptomyces sp. NA04227]QKW07611.1 ATP-binding protein [Streptomyces sp. NA04227]